jgi:hypothetical protein
MQLLIGLNRCGHDIGVPRTLPAPFALVIFLCGTSSDHLHASRDNLWAGVFDQEVDVVGRHYIV